MKRQLRVLQKLFIFIMFSMYFSCEVQEDNLKYNNLNKTTKIRYLYGEEAFAKAKELKKLIVPPNVMDTNSNFRVENNGTIDYSKILEVIDTTGVSNYTFKVLNHPNDSSNVFHNLVLSQKIDNSQEVLLIKYDNDYQSLKISEFKGEVSIKNISISTNPCDDITAPVDFSGISNPNNGGGGSGDVPINNPITFFPISGSTGGGGSLTVSDMPYFLCSSPGCHFASNSWAGYSVHTYTANGNTYIYPFTLVFRFSQRNSSVSVDPCSPDGSIGVLDEDDDPKTPCEKIKKITNNTTNLKSNITDFKNPEVINLNFEKGFRFEDNTQNATELIQNDGTPNKTSVELLLNWEGTITGFIHTHFNASDMLPIFTIEDLKTLDAIYQIRKYSGKPLDKVTVMLVSRAGVFAMIIEDFTKMDAEGPKLQTEDPTEFEDLKEKFYGDFLTIPNHTDYDIIKQVTKMLPNYGVSLFKANSDLSNWDKLTYDSSNNKVIPTPCN